MAKNQKSQSSLEYLLLMAMVVSAIWMFCRPEGPLEDILNKQFNDIPDLVVAHPPEISDSVGGRPGGPIGPIIRIPPPSIGLPPSEITLPIRVTSEGPIIDITD